MLSGSRGVDELLFKGSRKAPLVQRIGVAVMAFFYFMVALLFVSLATEQHQWFEAAIAAILFALATRFLRNAFLR